MNYDNQKVNESDISLSGLEQYIDYLDQNNGEIETEFSTVVRRTSSHFSIGSDDAEELLNGLAQRKIFTIYTRDYLLHMNANHNKENDMYKLSYEVELRSL